MSTELQTKGRGYIRVSASLWDETGKPETPEAWHKVLLLPETYEIERIEHHEYGDARGNVFDVFVQHEDIPIIGDHTPMPEVRPFYRAEYHEGETTLEKKAFLDRIEIWAWQDGQWKQEQL